MAKSRRTDPRTSYEAAREAEASGRAGAQRDACLAEVRRNPGKTAAEIAQATGLERHAPSRRLPELRESGLVLNGAARRCAATGRASLTWLPAKEAIVTNVLDLFLRESDREYHGKAKDFLSSHGLADFRKAPLLFWKKKLGLVGDEDRPAFLLGRGVHSWVLEGREAFNRAFVVGGPINPRTGKTFGSNTQAYQEWAAAQGKPVLTDEQFALVQNIVSGVSDHEGACKLLGNGIAERVLRAEYCGKPSQIRIDWYNPASGIVDLKTCDDLTWFEADAKRYGYAYQLAFYQAVLGQVTNNTAPVFMIAVEKKEPYRCGVWSVSQQTLDYARKENESAIERLKACEHSQLWPTGYEECRVFDAI